MKITDRPLITIAKTDVTWNQSGNPWFTGQWIYHGYRNNKIKIQECNTEEKNI